MFKLCGRCNTEKNLSEFRKNASYKDGLSPHCKLCKRETDKSNYSQKYGEKAKVRNKQRYDAAQAYVWQYKLEHPCACGETDPCCLEFHHSDPNVKEFQIADSKNRSLDKLKQEISKCIVVCSNCHKKIHYHGSKVFMDARRLVTPKE